MQACHRCICRSLLYILVVLFKLCMVLSVMYIVHGAYQSKSLALAHTPCRLLHGAYGMRIQCIAMHKDWTQQMIGGSSAFSGVCDGPDCC